MKRIIYLISVFCLLSISIFAQTASVETGCVPLVVNFDAPNAAGYYWDFKDGATSVLQNPDHTYTQAGQYEVELRNSQSSSIVGTVTITVFEDPIIEIDASIDSGCSPLVVDFNSFITLDPGLTIQSVSWAFGDGTTSSDLNPSHTYTNSGVFSVSLQVITNEMACDKIEIFTDLIFIEGVGNVSFSLDFNELCQVPATVFLNNNSFQGPGVTNQWDFGNGTTSTEREPGSVTYTEPGIYEIELTVTNSLGCSETFSETFPIDQYDILVELPDTVCLGATFQILNSTEIESDSFFWFLGPTASPIASGLDSPTVSFNTIGLKNIQLFSVLDEDCIIENNFQLYVDAANANFSISPASGCVDPQQVVLTADDPNQATYTWNGNIVGQPQIEYEIVCPSRDSLHINLRDSVRMSLAVTSFSGCVDNVALGYINRKPQADFIPSVTQGCAPLSVFFTDISESLNGIESTVWNFGDGTIINNELIVSHTYNEPGEYYVQLMVETPDGCQDTSTGRWIQVGAPIAPIYNISNTAICLGETVEISLLNNDPRIDGWHVYTDDSRTGHCGAVSSMSHQFATTAGVYDVEFSVNYNGCYTDITAPEQITVNGTNADIDYMINCETPYDIMLQNGEPNANQVTWQIDNVVVSNLDSLMYTFSDRGDYLLTLITEDDSNCPADTSTIDIFIREPVAAFEVPEHICDNIAYTYDASASIDVDGDGCHGYLWKFPDQRPREIDTAVVDQIIEISGLQEITLIVEDMHGCRDTTTRSTEVFGINALMEAEKDRACIPDNITFLSLSSADTTFTLDWSFGSQSTNPSISLTDTSLDSFPFSLRVEDALGCTEVVTKQIDFYKVETEIDIDPFPFVCFGEEVTFSATDFTEEGSFLNFTWDFGSTGTSNERIATVVFNQTSFFNVNLTYEEESSGCGGTFNEQIFIYPEIEPSFETSFDSLDQICAPAQIELYNTTDYPWTLNPSWYVDEQGPFIGDSTIFVFDKGRHVVDLVMTTANTCADTISKSFTLIGPEGTFSIDPVEICVGEDVSFTLIDTVDVSIWEWDFGDGNIVAGGNPVSHVFDFVPETGATNVNLTLFSEATGCETIQTLPVDISEPKALFDQLDTLAYCNGVVFLNNLSTDANEFTWSKDGQVFSNETTPRLDLGLSGTFEITLLASVIGKTCSSEYTTEITLDSVPPLIELPNVFTPNGDGNNDNFNLVVTDAQFDEFVNIITFKIYNRWGELVYDNDNPTIGWDGDFKNQEAPTELYAYYIEYELIDCNNEAKKGNVTILR